MNATVTAIGSLLSAFLSSLCCTGPLILGVFGVGAGATATSVKALVPYRPVFITLALLCLVLGFVLVYRRKGACTAGLACNDGTERMMKVALWGATIGTLILLVLPELLAVGI